MIFSFVTLFLLISTILILLYDSCNRTDRLMRKIPGPRRWPIVGNSLEILLPRDKLFLYLRILSRKYGDVCQVHAFNSRSIGFLDLDSLEKILSSTQFTGKHIPYSFLKPWLGEGILTSQGIKWHQRRKLLTQAFHFNILKKYTSTFIEQAEKFVENIQERVGEKETDVAPLINSATLRIVCEAAMGTSMREGIETVVRKYFEALNIITETIITRICRIWLHTDWFFKWSKTFKLQAAAIKDLHFFTSEVINQRRNFLQDNHIETFEDEENYGYKGKLAMLDLLLIKEKEGAIDSNGIREEVETIMFEGHDTTAHALIFMLIAFANETEIQEKIYEEMKNIFGNSQRTPTLEDLNEMKYLECCIKESLRLYPSVPIITRYITEEMTIGGYTLPKNSHIHINIYEVHRREDIYPEPERFIPERFLPEACAKRHPYAYLPFSAGARNCIGQKFAMLEMKTLLSSLLRRFRLEPVTRTSDIKFKTDILLCYDNPSLNVKFHNRY